MQGTTPIIKDVVLVGGGHAHVAVLKNFAMRPLPGVALTLISGDSYAAYSGMLPGYIAGHYSYDDVHIDLQPLCRFAGARFIHDEVTALDSAGRRLHCREHPPIDYDVLSINIGSRPAMDLPSSEDESVLAVKPITGFFEKWAGLCADLPQHTGPLRIGVVGAGAGGVELILAVQHRLLALLNTAGLSSIELEFHLFTDREDILVSHNRFARRMFEGVLGRRGIQIHRRHQVVDVQAGALHFAGGQQLVLDEIFWVTNASAQSWPAEAGLAVDERGFIEVGNTLESVSHAGIFAAGDIASVRDQPRPKSGVFAVRQGQPLARNIRRYLLGKSLQRVKLQKNFLSLISTGDKYVIASRGGWALQGRWLWRWKDWIDRRFVAKYRQLPAMLNTKALSPVTRALADSDFAAELDDMAMRCGGCGAKLGADLLRQTLRELNCLTRDDVLTGLQAPDDAAVVRPPANKLMVHSVDSFRAFIDDPYVFGQIAAQHALNDLYAMGAEPQTALALVTLPFAPQQKMAAQLSQLMQGAVKVLNEAGAALVGGHSAEASEVSLGFAVNGLLDEGAAMHKAGMRVGDALILTRALGTGTLFAADMRARASGRWISAALSTMCQSNREAARCLQAHGASACTDVSGFGLLGHLLEMLKASAVSATLNLPALPVLDGALACIDMGIVSSLQRLNLSAAEVLSNATQAQADPRYALLFDPQTAGGLLASVAPAALPDCLQALHALGYTDAVNIGTVQAAAGGEVSVELLL